METKKCSKCGKIRAISEYYPRHNDCNVCAREACKQYRIKNKERQKKRLKAWRLKNKDHVNAYAKEYRKKNRDECIKRNKEWRLKNKDYVNEYRIEYLKKNEEIIKGRRKKYHLKNRDEHIKRNKEWRLKNKEYVKEYWKKYVMELSDGYIANELGVSLKDAPKELIEAKREIMKINRLIKQIQS